RHTRFSRYWSSDVCSSELRSARDSPDGVGGSSRSSRYCASQCPAPESSAEKTPPPLAHPANARAATSATTGDAGLRASRSTGPCTAIAALPGQAMDRSLLRCRHGHQPARLRPNANGRPRAAVADSEEAAGSAGVLLGLGLGHGSQVFLDAGRLAFQTTQVVQLAGADLAAALD